MSSAYCGGYRIIAKLGKGTFGVVYKVERSSDGKLFALKQIQPMWSTPMDRLEREVISHKSLSAHPNILEFIEYFKTSGKMNIVLEYCELGNLEEYLTNRSLDQNTAVSFMMDMASGLNHLHNNGIVHRDIKPENILLSRGQYTIPQCKISDFGVANMSSFQSEKLACENMGSLAGEEYFHTLCGTPVYLAPEVTERHYTKSCDIFSLGVVFYILFSPQRTSDGRLAPWVKNGTLFFRAKDPEIVEEIRQYIHDETLCRLIACMMKVDYHDRISAPAILEKLVEIALSDDEIFLVACLLFGICLLFLLFPFPLFVLCLVLLGVFAKEFCPGLINAFLN